MKTWYRVSFRAYASQNIARNESVISKLNRSKKNRKQLPIQTVDVFSESLNDALNDAHNSLIAGGGVSYVEIFNGRPLKSELTEQQCRDLLNWIDNERARLRLMARQTPSIESVSDIETTAHDLSLASGLPLEDPKITFISEEREARQQLSKLELLKNLS